MRLTTYRCTPHGWRQEFELEPRRSTPEHMLLTVVKLPAPGSRQLRLPVSEISVRGMDRKEFGRDHVLICLSAVPRSSATGSRRAGMICDVPVQTEAGQFIHFRETFSPSG